MKNPILLLNKYGILTLTENGKILFLFITEVIGLIFLSLIIRNWEFFNQDSYGMAVLILSVITISFLFISIFFKPYFKIYYSEYLKQTGILIFIILVYLILYNYHRQEINTEFFYLNPITMLYIFVLFYFFTFYLIQNMI